MNLSKLLILAAFALPSLAQAELTKLDTSIVPADRFVHPNDVVSVTATGDTGPTLEYRFVVEYRDGANWTTVAARDWAAGNNFSFDTSVGGPYTDGNYRLVTLARESGAPEDFIANYQAFTLTPADSTLCDYLNGKTFINAAPVGQTLALGTVSVSDALASLGPPGYPYSVTSFSAGIASMHFDNGTVSVMPVSEISPLNQNRIQAHVCSGMLCYDIDAHMDFTGSPVSGTYSCNNDVVNIDASGMATTDVDSLVSLLVGNTGYLHITGNIVGNTLASTLTANGTVFTLQGAAANVPTPGVEKSSGGAFGLFSLLALLGLGRRRRV